MVKTHGSLKNRYAEDVRTKDAGAGGGPFVFPAEVKFYKPKEARNRIIILPFEIKSKNHPLVAQGRWKVGEPDYVMDVWVHQRVGPGEIDMVCLKKNYHRACPACELAEEYREKGKDQEYKAMKPSRRVAYNVVNARNPEGGVQVFTASHYLFHKELIEEAAADGGGEIVDFVVMAPSDIHSGKIISFRGSMTTMGKNEYLEFKSFSFEDREDKLDVDLLNDCVAFDEVMKVFTYEEMQNALYGQDEVPEEEEEHEDRPRKGHEREDDRPAARKVHDDEDERPHRSRDEDGRDGGRKEREEEREEPRGRSREERHEPDKEKVAEDECPHGHRFAVDWDKTKDCEKCKIWDKCGDALEARKKAAAAGAKD